MNELELTGRARTHIVDIDHPRCALHYEAVAAFLAMRDAAAADGLQLEAASSYRDFDRQVAVWNDKWCGRRPLVGRDGQPLDAAGLDEASRIDAILAWSAVPGGSRHHWGSDIDVIDRAAIPADYRVRLVPAEYAQDGVFAALGRWLDGHMQRFGFFRPFRRDRGGVMPEPWHLSYAPVSLPAIEQLDLSVLRRALQGSALDCKAQVLARLPEIYTRFVLAIDPP